MTTHLIILLVLIALSAFFSASEVAFISLTDAKVDSMVKRKLPKATIIKQLTSNRRRLLVTILIGNNIVNIASASLATVVASSIFQSAVIGVTTGVMTLVVLVFGEVLPKSYAANHPKQFAVVAARYIWFLSFIGRPIIVIFEWLTNMLAGEQTDERISEEELRAMAYVSVKQGSIEHSEGQMIQKLFQFNDISAEDIMTPRVDVAYFDDDITIGEAIDVVKQHSFTRYPVVHNTPDDVIGFIHSRDLLLVATDKQNASLKQLMRPVLHVPRQLPIDELLKEFQKKQTHMAVVTDEHGGTEGIATLEDVIEELVGEIADEHDVEDEVIKRIDKSTILASGETPIREINHFFNVELPGDPLDTISEIIIETAKKVPRKGMIVEFDHVRCRVENTKKKVIQLVRIEKDV